MDNLRTLARETSAKLIPHTTSVNNVDTILSSFKEAVKLKYNIPQDLLTSLRKRYTAEEIPVCCICGSELNLASCGGGRATEWACDGQEDDPDRPGFIRYKEGRFCADEHYSKSRWTQYKPGDKEVLNLLDILEGNS